MGAFAPLCRSRSRANLPEDGSGARNNPGMASKPDKSLSRSIGEFFGHIWKGVKEPVAPAPGEKQILRQESSEEVLATEAGNVIVRRTIVEELEVPAAPRKT